MSEPIRIAQVMGKMLGGGVESVVMNYYRHIDRNRVQFDFIVDEDSTLVPREEIEALGGRVIEVPPYQKLPEYLSRLESLFKSGQWKIVHSHINTLSVFPLYAAKKAGVPVRIAHSHSTAGTGEHAKNALKYALRPLARVFPSDLFACGDYAGRWLYGPDAEFRVVPNAIELGKFAFDPAVREEARSELGITDDALVIGHLGRFVDQKNHAFLLDVFASLRAMNPKAVLVLAGEGPLLEATKEQAAELGIADSVKFLGQRSDADRLYQAFDVFVLPSLYEGLCVVGVEAQAAGLPCVFSGEVTEEVGLSENAIFLPLSDSPQTWAEAIRALGEPSTRQAPAAIGAFDIEKAAANLAVTYEDLANRGNGARAALHRAPVFPTK